jgi:hypothetical protein
MRGWMSILRRRRRESGIHRYLQERRATGVPNVEISLNGAMPDAIRESTLALVASSKR